MVLHSQLSLQHESIKIVCGIVFGVPFVIIAIQIIVFVRFRTDFFESVELRARWGLDLVGCGPFHDFVLNRLLKGSFYHLAFHWR